jgi:hypothetical protein
LLTWCGVYDKIKTEQSLYLVCKNKKKKRKKKKEKERGIEREWDCQGDEAPQYLIEES